MGSKYSTLVDDVDRFLERVAAREEVAYAEVGGRWRDGARVVVTESGAARSGTPIEKTTLWCRVFAHGEADYRSTSDASPDALEELLDRAIRSCRHVAGDDDALVDRETRHRDVHDGWCPPDAGLDDVSPEEIEDRLKAGRGGALDGLDVDRARFAYEGGRLTDLVMTTTGSTVRTVRDRASVTVTLAGETTVRDHLAAATGRDFLRTLPDRIAAAGDRAAERWDAEPATPPEGARTALLAPTAAGRLFHALVRYLEADTVLSGSSPFEVGDALGPEELRIVDRPAAGSWGAFAYDATARPTTPVRLVDGGRVRSYLHDAATAAAFGGAPGGSVVPAESVEDQPRIAARHVDVDPGDVPTDDLREGAAVELTRLGEPTFGNEATRTKRESRRPPNALYARRAREQTPDAFADEPDEQTLRFPIEAGYVVDDGERAGRLDEGTLVVDPNALDDLRLGVETATLTGTTAKHDSRLPLAATAPATQLRARLER